MPLFIRDPLAVEQRLVEAEQRFRQLSQFHSCVACFRHQVAFPCRRFFLAGPNVRPVFCTS